VNMTNGTLIAKINRQETASTRYPPIRGPITVAIAVAVIGGLGALARVLFADSVALRASRAERGVAAVNVTGAFLLGLLFSLHGGETLKLLAGTALLGSYTTFSGWQLAARGLVREGEPARARALVAGTLVVGVGAAWLGVALG